MLQGEGLVPKYSYHANSSKLLTSSVREVFVSDAIMNEDLSWDEAKLRYPVGSTVRWAVVHREVFGVFVESEDGVLGIIEATEFPGGKSITPEEFPRLGELVQARVLGYRDSNKEVLLSIRSLDPV